MVNVSITIGGRVQTIACKDGGEDQLRRLGAMLDQRWPAATRASGGRNGERTMMFVALMLADALDEAERRPPADASAALLDGIAERLEALAESLEKMPAKPYIE